MRVNRPSMKEIRYYEENLGHKDGYILHRTHIIALNKITSWYYRPVYILRSQTNWSEVTAGSVFARNEVSSNILSFFTHWNLNWLHGSPLSSIIYLVCESRFGSKLSFQVCYWTSLILKISILRTSMKASSTQTTMKRFSSKNIPFKRRKE